MALIDKWSRELWSQGTGNENQVLLSQTSSLRTFSFSFRLTFSWTILQEIRIPDHLTCLLRNLYADQEATVRTRHGTTVQFSSVQSLSHVWFFATPWTAAHLASLSWGCSNSCPLSRLCHPAISSSVIPSPLAFNLSQHQGLFKWVTSSHQVAKVLKCQLQHQSSQRILRTDFI